MKDVFNSEAKQEAWPWKVEKERHPYEERLVTETISS